MGKQSCVFWWGQGCQSWRKSPLDMASSLRTSAKRDSGGSGWELQHSAAPSLGACACCAPARVIPVPEIYFLEADNLLLSSSWCFRCQSKGGEPRFQEPEQLCEQNILELALSPPAPNLFAPHPHLQIALFMLQ